MHAFVTSKVDYCNSLLYGVPKYVLQRLQRVLNCAARKVFKSNKYDHITPLLRELHWLPIQQRIEFKILLITFKALNKQAPTYLTDLLISHTPSRSLRSSSKNLLKIPMHNLKSYGGRSFALASAVLWNSLPQSLRDLQSVETFKLKVKEHLFLRAYMEHWILHCYCTFYELYLIFNRHRQFVIIISLLWSVFGPLGKDAI